MTEMHSLVGPFVADALDDEERADFDAHLATCGQCRDEVAELRETMAEVGALHEVTPPPMLRASILGAIATTPMLPAEEAQPVAEEQVAAPKTPSPASNVLTPTHGFSRSRRPISTWLAAVAAVLVVALGGVTVWQQSHLQSIQAADAQRIELLAAPDLQVNHTTLAGGELTYLVSQSRGQAIVTAAALPDPGTDRSWQVWVMQDGVPRSGAIIDDGGRVSALITGVGGGDALAITNEPRGGSPAPTGEVLAAVEL